MKSHSSRLRAIWIISIPIFLFYLYQFGYRIVDRAFSVYRLKNNLDQPLFSGHSINYSEISSPVIIVLLLLILSISYKNQSK
jgi:hypothetical protein